ncbi:MAG: hypothetical protein ABSB74_04320 [Tepidisphaeraceae bacterium]
MKAFLKKIEAERALLSVVNQNDRLPELTGASLAAVEEWCARSVPKNIAGEVLKLSSMISGLAERSGERFDERHHGDTTRVRKAIHALSHKLNCREENG